MYVCMCIYIGICMSSTTVRWLLYDLLPHPCCNAAQHLRPQHGIAHISFEVRTETSSTSLALRAVSPKTSQAEEHCLSHKWGQRPSCKGFTAISFDCNYMFLLARCKTCAYYTFNAQPPFVPCNLYIMEGLHSILQKKCMFDIWRTNN